MEETLFVDVIVPLAVAGRFTYRVPRALNAQVGIGIRVLVQFGKRKVYTGVVVQVHTTPPKDHQAKYLVDVIDEQPSVTPDQLALWLWMADYYMCNEGDVLQAALPTGLKLSSEQVVCMHPDFDGDLTELDLTELAIIEVVQEQGKVELDKLAAIAQGPAMPRIVAKLVQKRILIYAEEIDERYRARTESYLRLNDALAGNDQALREVFDQLARAPKQLDMLMRFIHLSRLGNEDERTVAQKDLAVDAGGGAAAMRALIDKQILIKFDVEVSRLAHRDAWATTDVVLSAEQESALEQINAHFATKDVCLLHGVTSSGKTEVFIRLIQEYLAAGRQVLYLLPEIALTAQIVRRLQKHFGAEVGMYHSRMTDHERVEVWQRMLSPTPYKLVLGARSGLFLPFQNLGLVVVDEEHDTSYKQHDPAPRYNARDCAIVLAQRAQAKVLLGSATPCIESMHNCTTGRYGLVRLTQRYGGATLPEVRTVDLRIERKEKTMKGPFSSVMLAAVALSIEKREQVILFQNRRGFSSFIQCEQCGDVPHCERCDISLTYHKYSHDLRCHYCGFTRTMPRQCGKCQSTRLITLGLGTEQVEEELNIHFPQARVVRMDLDTTRARHAHHRIIQDFEAQQIDILVGTQMVTKGLDFNHVGLVGIMNADQLLRHSDFRAFERAYQLMAQVSGRAGRRNKQGLVLIQTSEPEHAVIKLVQANDHATMVSNESSHRQAYNYPPFARLVQITVKNKDREWANASAHGLAAMIKALPGITLLGPEIPAIGRIRNFYLQQMLIKLPGPALVATKRAISQCIGALREAKEHRASIIQVDVDPQ